jgi:hypothetical protein
MNSYAQRTSVRLLAIVFISITVCGVQLFAQRKPLPQAVVIPELLSVYAQASGDGTIVTQLKKGATVSVVLKISNARNGWCLVQLPGQAQAIGYVSCDGLQSGKESQAAINHTSSATTPSNIPSAAASPSTSMSAPVEQHTNMVGVLRNKDIVDMSKAGLPAEVLIAKMRSTPYDFDTSPAALETLKKDGVSDGVILAVVQSTASSTQTRPVDSRAVNPSPQPPPPSSAVAETAADTSVPQGSKVFIEPMTNGFETYLAAALEKKKVPLVIVTEAGKADFVLTGNADTRKAGWAKIVFMGNIHSDEEASVSMVNVKSGAVVFAYAVNKKNTLHGQQTTAEACAKHLKAKIEGHD